MTEEKFSDLEETRFMKKNHKIEHNNSLLAKLIEFCSENGLMVFLGVFLLIMLGLRYAPFDLGLTSIPRDPVPVDAIPDIGENQQVLFTSWPGISPQDMEDQITYPLVTVMMGLPGLKTIRASSMFGFSSIYLIFRDDVDFYWSRSRILEKLQSLPSDLLPEGIKPSLGPDATALGQIFWYTLEGRDSEGNPSGGWDLDELRTIQDRQVRYALASVEGVSEVAGIGGYVREYQVEVDPDALRIHDVKLNDVINAAGKANSTVGARTLELNGAEYLVKADGYVKKTEDIANAPIRSPGLVPLTVDDVADVGFGPAQRMGVLDKEGVEVVGGVVVVRYGANPFEVIRNVNEKIEAIAQSLPERILQDGSESRVTIVPFYDRTELIKETLGTLFEALSQQMLVTVIVVILMVFSLRSSLIISLMLPLVVLGSFILMKYAGVDANIVALSGIAIAIGTIVDMGIVLCENIVRKLDEEGEGAGSRTRATIVVKAAQEVGSAVLTAVLTTIVAFMPVFSMTGAEGKLFRPLAFTNVFALSASILLTLVVLPPLAVLLFKGEERKQTKFVKGWNLSVQTAVSIAVTMFLTQYWLPLGPEHGFVSNFIFVLISAGLLLIFFYFIHRYYRNILGLCLKYRLIFLIIPISILIWTGRLWSSFGREFMPYLDEGSFLFMPSTTPHASIGTVTEMLKAQDRAISSIPEIKTAVGKIGRVDSALDPAPLGMVETVIQYHPEYLLDENGNRMRFAYAADEDDLFRSPDGTPVNAPDGLPYKVHGKYDRDENGNLIYSEAGVPFRMWRMALDPDLNQDREEWPGIRKPDDIWDEIIRAGRIPGMTSAEKLQPISTRIVMLQTGIRGSMALKISGPDKRSISEASLIIENALKKDVVSELNHDLINLDRSSGDWKPYLVLDVDRETAARFGLSIKDIHSAFSAAVGGKRIGTVVEKRDRIPVLVRLKRERRDSMEDILNLPLTTSSGTEIPLKRVASLRYEPGPAMIKSENAELTGYIFIGAKEGVPEVEAAEAVKEFIVNSRNDGSLKLPQSVNVSVVGTYENQVRAMKTLKVILPLSLILIFIILHLQFRSIVTTLMIFSGISVAWAGGFILLWLYGQPWFMNFSAFGINLRELFQMGTINLSVAVWVGFLALFGIATDDGVVMCTYMEQRFRKREFSSIKEIREEVVEAGQRRVRSCLMTTATTVLALLPVLTSTGRGSDIMVPMAIPVFGGMLLEVLTMLVVPVLYSIRKELQWARKN